MDDDMLYDAVPARQRTHDAKRRALRIEHFVADRELHFARFHTFQDSFNLLSSGQDMWTTGWIDVSVGHPLGIVAVKGRPRFEILTLQSGLEGIEVKTWFGSSHGFPQSSIDTQPSSAICPLTITLVRESVKPPRCSVGLSQRRALLRVLGARRANTPNRRNTFSQRRSDLRYRGHARSQPEALSSSASGPA